MEKGLNSILNNLKNDIIKLVNESQIPVGVAYYIIKDIYHDISVAYENAVLNELKSQATDIQEKEDVEISEEK